MASSVLAIEEGNAKNVVGLCKPTIKLKLLQFEQFANIFTKEPYLVYVRRTKETDLLTGSTMFYYRKHILNTAIASWTIYNLDNDNGDFLVRYSYWDKMSDMKQLYDKDRSISKADYKATLSSRNYYIKKQDLNRMSPLINSIKRKLSKGISFSKEGASEDIVEQELSMWLDGYRASYTWQYPLLNSDLNDSLSKFILEFENLIMHCDYSVDEIQLDYSCPLDIFNKYIIGSEDKEISDCV